MIRKYFELIKDKLFYVQDAQDIENEPKETVIAVFFSACME